MSYQRIETNVFCNQDDVIVEINRLNEDDQIDNIDAKAGVTKFIPTDGSYCNIVEDLVKDHTFGFDPADIRQYDKSLQYVYFLYYIKGVYKYTIKCICWDENHEQDVQYDYQDKSEKIRYYIQEDSYRGVYDEFGTEIIDEEFKMHPDLIFNNYQDIISDDSDENE